MKQDIQEYRKFLKNSYWPEWESLERDQPKGVAPPPLGKEDSPGKTAIPLVPPEEMEEMGGISLREVIEQRISRRRFSGEKLTLKELSFLLWSTQGVKEIDPRGTHTLRTVPSAGARHPFETYLIVKQVEELEPGLFHYQALRHELVFLSPIDELEARAAVEYWLKTEEAVLFIWAVIPYRTEWRYGILSHKMIALDAGHICQNLYLASEAIGAGTCAIGAYWQEEMDDLLGLDGEEEFTIYMARV
jgi:SagB-type dehydrogenase family enzyme